MARIPESEINRIKQDISLQRLAESAGLALKRHGADLIGLCPFHDDKTPSLVISPKSNLWHCLGACQAGGSVIDWVMKTEGVSFRHAVELLQNDSFSSLAAKAEKLSADSNPVKGSAVQTLPSPLAQVSEDGKLLAQVIDYYHQTLKNSPEALAYLQKRGIDSSEAIDRFKLGFANRTLGYRLPMKKRKEGAAIRGQLQRIGLLRASGHEHFNGSIVIPVFRTPADGEAQTAISEVYGRKIRDDLRKGTPKHCYLPGAHAGVWNEAALKTSPEIILCESLIDALTFWCAGFRNVTASYGIEGFTTDHTLAFKQYGTERVLIAYDRDEAGDRAAEKLATQLIEAGMDCYRIQFPKGMDANEYALQVTPASKSLGVVIRSAIWLGKGRRGKRARDLTSCDPAERLATDGEGGTIRQERTNALESESLPPQSAIEPQTAAKKEKSPPTVTHDYDPGHLNHFPSLVADRTEPTPLPATPVPASPKPVIDAEIKTLGDGEEVVITLGERRYRIRGLTKNLNYEQLKVNLLVSCPALGGAGDAVHVDTLDLYQSRPRGLFIKQAAVELGLKEEVIKHDLGKILLKLETEQEQRLDALQAPQQNTVTLSDEDTQAALALLKSPDLLTRIQADFRHCGIVGEAINTLTGYLACVSRKLDKPLAILIQSTSAAGKSALMDAVLNLMPEEERIQYSAMTGQSLFYLGETDLKHKILGIAEEEGVSEASYALKLLQSQGELTIASTGKDPQSGKMITQEYHVEGPVMIFLTTTAIELDEELLNRCLVLTVNESREQTAAIQHRQRFEDTLEGLLANQSRAHILNLHHNAQRLLKPIKVVNPYADRLTFLSDKTRTRRDHAKYLTLIKTITLLHQYQREIKVIQHQDQIVEYIEVALDDIETANQIAHEVLGRTLDELPPQTRRLLNLIDEHIYKHCKTEQIQRSDFRFSRRDVREFSGWTDFQIKTHMKKLETMEYVLVHRGGRGQSFVYELLYNGEGEKNETFLMGLIDTASLKHHYDKKKERPKTHQEPSKAKLSGSSSLQRAAKEPSSRPEEKGNKPIKTESYQNTGKKGKKDTLAVTENNDTSYHRPVPDKPGGGICETHGIN